MDFGGSTMLLKSIKLENFRQFVNEEISFSMDKNNNVTLIIGDNGTGKTTFLQAFFWCLYGRTDFADSSVLNHAIMQSMTPDDIAEVKVTLALQHGTAKYEIVRKQVYKKKLSNKVVGDNTVLNICVTTADGITKWLKPIECENEIQKIMPQELARYFFFDGERIEKLSKEVSSGKKSSGFSEAIMGLTGLKAILSALNHITPKKTNSVMGRLNQELSGDSSSELAKLNADYDALQTRLSEIDDELSSIDDQIAEASSHIHQYSEDLKGFEESEKLQEDREKAGKYLDREKKNKAEKIKDITKLFNKDLYSFFALKMVSKSLEELKDSDLAGKDIPDMHANTIHYLLDRGTCICGTDLSKGTVPYKNVEELLHYLPPEAIGVTVGNFINTCKRDYSHDVSLFAEISETIGELSAYDDSIASYQQEIDEIDNVLRSDNVADDIKALQIKIQSCRDTKKGLENTKASLHEEKGEKSSELNRIDSRRTSLSLQNKQNEKIIRSKEYAQVIFDQLTSEYNTKEEEVRETLETTMNTIFKKIYNGGLSVSIDSKYNVRVFADESEFDVETSTAQSISVIFAFISAIIKMARDNQASGGDNTYSEPYPLVMDAPLSAFDKTRIQAVCEAIPETAEQVIIFIKDTDGELAERHLGAKVSERHSFEKIDEFHTQLK